MAADKILITNFESMDELYDYANDLLRDEGVVEDEPETWADLGTDFWDIVYEKVDEIYYDEITEIYDAYDLEQYWRHNGWTLDRGYGGPNYKERVADNMDWDALWELISWSWEENPSWGTVVLTPVQLNDLVIFSDEWLPEEDEDEEFEG